jgi:hypothetical protein
VLERVAIEMLSNTGGKVDGEHLGGPLGGETCMIGYSKGIIGM